MNKVFAAKPHKIDGREVDIKGAVSKSAQNQKNEYFFNSIYIFILYKLVKQHLKQENYL